MSAGVTRRYFRNQDNILEQNLINSLVNEAVEVAGIDCYYVARELENYDKIYETDDQSLYRFNWMLAIYIKNIMGFAGDKDFMSKFAGLEIRDQIIVEIPRNNFDMVVAQDANFPPLPLGMPQPAARPREGDIIFIPFRHLNKCFQIKYVNLTDMFFPLGTIPCWSVTCELFEYSNETFATGIPELDRLNEADSNILNYLMTDLNGTPILCESSKNYWVVDKYNPQAHDPLEDNQNIRTEANTYVANTPVDPYVDPTTISGVF